MYSASNMNRLPQCDSYFVESDADMYAAEAQRRQYEKLIKSQRQDLMADELTMDVRRQYQDDIVAHMLFMEKQTLPDVASIDIQEEIQWFMRPYLIDFLVEAHTFFQLLPETMFLAINLLDRYCSRRVVYKRHYQLVGCAALLIAAKYGDKKERVPLIRELKTMCCMLYEEEMFTQMEWHVLNTLDWVIGHPTVDSFLQLSLASSMEEDIELEHMAWYIAEIALYHREFVSIRPSVLARSTLALARGILGRREVIDAEWGHEENSVLLLLSQQLQNPSEVLAKKYSTPYMSRTSSVLESFLAHQEAMARRATPATPPYDAYQSRSMENKDYIYNTPQKPTYHQAVVNGYLTPPITPDGDCHGAAVGGVYQDGAQRRPITPTPCNNNTLYPPQHHVSYHHYQI